MPPAVEFQNLNHWTIREVSKELYFGYTNKNINVLVHQKIQKRIHQNWAEDHEVK